MARLLKIQSEDSSLTAIDLLGGTLLMVEGSRTTRLSEEDVIETMELIVPFGTTDANIITYIHYLSLLADAAEKWGEDRIRRYAVWLYENAASETARRSLIKDIQFLPKNIDHTSQLLGRSSALFDLVITRVAAWENVSADTYSQDNVNAWGGEWAITPVAADVAAITARIKEFQHRPHNPTSGVLSEFWFGIRETREVSKTADFQPIWELENGTSLSADTALGSESGASPSGSSSNNKFVCTFATTASMADRLGITVDQATGASTNYDHQVGKYLVLLRARVDSGVTAYVRMKSGYKNTYTQHRDVQITYVSGGYWLLYPLGEITIPSFQYRAENAGATLVANSSIRIMAERVAGSGSLHLDAICLIPTDHFVYQSVEGVDMTQYVNVYTHADGTMTFLKKNSSNAPESSGDHAQIDWGLPVSGGVLVACAQIAGQWHRLIDSMDLDADVYPRWRLYAL